MQKNVLFFLSKFIYFSSGMIVSATLVSVFSVGLIAVDRFLFIMYGLQYQRYIYPTRARILIFLTWFLGESLSNKFQSFKHIVVVVYPNEHFLHLSLIYNQQITTSFI